MLWRLLSCNVLGVPRQPFTRYVDAVRTWLGGDDPELLSSTFVTWQEPERVEFEGSAWIRQVKDLRLLSRRGVAIIGSRGDRDLVAVMSSFAAVNASLENHLASHVSEAANISDQAICTFDTDLARLYRSCTAKNMPGPEVRFIEGRRRDDGAVIGITAPSGPSSDDLPDLDLLSLGVKIEGLDATIFGNTSMLVDTANSNPEDVSIALTRFFEIVGEHLTPRPQGFENVPGGAVDNLDDDIDDVAGFHEGEL